MASHNETPEITPQVVHLIDLLKRAREGRLRVPRFQRDYVWRRENIVDLFDSIARQYPIGTLFLWGAEQFPSSRDQIGPLRLPEYRGETWLILDGQQRLTTLVGVLLAGEPQWSSAGDEDPARWELYFDAKADGFTHARPGEDVPIFYVPVPALLDTMKLFSQVEKMMRAMQSPPQSAAATRKDIEEWISRAQEIARAIQGYRIPIVEIKTNNLSIAVESFSRLNKKGRSIGQDEMFSALTYEEGKTGGFHLATEIDMLQHDMIRSGFGEVDRTILLRSVLTAAGLDMYRTDWTQLGDQVKSHVRGQLPRAIAEAQTGLKHARTFLKELKVLNARMVPYSMQLVALSAFFGRCQTPSAAQKALLRRWFWSSSFAGWFGSGNPARVRRLVDELRDRVANDPSATSLENMDIAQPALPTPLRFDLRSARVRAMLCVLLARNPRRQDGSELEPGEAARLLLQRGPEAMSTLCATVRDDDLKKSPANRLLDVAPNVPGQAKNWIIDLDPSVRSQVLDSHAIPPDSLQLLMDDDNDAFLKRRLDFLAQLEREFMQQESVTPPASDTPASSPIDADDEPPLIQSE